MTIWQPDLSARQGPRYKAIADALADDISSGSLPPGTRLPTHRDLAYNLGVTVGTITRAYAEAERRGVVRGHVGRGTYVLGDNQPTGDRSDPLHGALGALTHSDSPGLIDFGPALLGPAPRLSSLQKALSEISTLSDADRLLDYETGGGMPRHRDVFASWSGTEAGVTFAADNVILSNGAQHAIVSSILATSEPGDVILAEGLVYPPLKAMTQMLGRRLVGVALDEHGVIPDALEEACRITAPRALYLNPTIQNPTTCIMPESRRIEIAALAERYGFIIIEDDIYGYLPGRTEKSFAALTPNRTLYISGLSKCSAPGLRIGCVASPASLSEAVRSSVRTTTWSASPLSLEVGCRWIEDGTITRLQKWHRNEAARRQAIGKEILGDRAQHSHPASYFMWLHLDQGWNSADLVARLAQQNVRVTGEDVFSIAGHDGTHGNPAPAVRIGLGNPPSDEMLKSGLSIIADTLGNAPIPQSGIF